MTFSALLLTRPNTVTAAIAPNLEAKTPNLTPPSILSFLDLLQRV